MRPNFLSVSSSARTSAGLVVSFTRFFKNWLICCLLMKSHGTGCRSFMPEIPVSSAAMPGTWAHKALARGSDWALEAAEQTRIPRNRVDLEVAVHDAVASGDDLAPGHLGMLGDEPIG